MEANSLEAGDSEPQPTLNNCKHPGGLGIKAVHTPSLKGTSAQGSGDAGLRREKYQAAEDTRGHEPESAPDMVLGFKHPGPPGTPTGEHVPWW